MTLFGSSFKFQEPPVMLVAVLMNFGVKNQVLQVSFKIVARDLNSLHNFGSDMNLFLSDNIWFKFQDLRAYSITCNMFHLFWCDKSSTVSLL